MRLNSLTVLLLVNLLFGLLWSVNAKSTSDSAEEDDDASKQLRRSEISKALGLLKKHSIIGKNAKIILKASGKHLLVILGLPWFARQHTFIHSHSHPF